MAAKTSSSKVTILMAAILTAASAVVGAQQTPQTTPPPTASGVLQGQAADRYVVGQAKPPEVPGSTTRDMTLEQAIQIALEKNLDLQVARMNPQLQDYTLQVARAAFRASVSGVYSYQNTKTLSTSQLEGAAQVISQSQTYNSTITQPLRWHGATVGATFNNSRSDSNSSLALRNPAFTSNLSFNITQPLLHNFSIDTTRNTIRTAQVQRQIEDIRLQTQVENTAASVRAGYWALRSAIEQIEINNRALQLAQRLLEDDKLKVEIGTMAQIETAQPEAAVATAEQQLLNARVTWQQAELSFKRLLVGGTDDELFRATINPVDPVDMLAAEQRVEIDAAVKRALSERTDLAQLRKGLESSQLNLEVTSNALKPDLNLTASYALQGVGGNSYARNQFGGQGTLIAAGGYSDALSNLIERQNPTWNLRFNFTYPIGMAAQRANLARAELQIDQSKASLKAQELNVATEVTNAGLAVQNTYLQLLAARKTREAAEKNAEAERTKFDVGLSTNFNVVNLQQQLTQARLNELGRLIAYVNAIAEFERVQKAGR